MMRQTVRILLLIALTACTGKAHKQVNIVKKESISVKTDQDENIHLPPNTSLEEITELFASRSKYPNNLVLLGIEKWKYRKDTYIALVRCEPNEQDSIDDMPLFLGMIDISDGLKLISVSDDISIQSIDWKHTLLHYIDEVPDNKNDSLYTVKLNQFTSIRELNFNRFSFDFIRYQITATEVAFGVWFEERNSYAGANCDTYSVLLLFRNEGNISNTMYKIKCILAQPMYSYQFYRACYEPGCEDHYYDKWEGENILCLLPSLTNGFYDLQIRKKKYVNNMGEKYPKNWKMNFHWDADSASYQPVN
jgi:hypothetical protein